MTTTILVPLDGSALAERALPVAQALATTLAAQVVLVGAVFIRAVPGFDATSEQVEDITIAERYLRAQVTTLRNAGIAATMSAVYGDPARAILDEARAHRADLIVMATHGRSGLGRLLRGSVASALLAHSSVPILLVRAWHASHNVERLTPGARLLVPLDGSVAAEQVLPVASNLASALHGEILLVRAIPPAEPVLAGEGMIPVTDMDYAQEMVAEAHDYLERIAGNLIADGHIVRSFAQIGAANDVIGAISRELGAALVIMATHGRTGLDRLLLGSVAEEVLRDGSAPLLLVRAQSANTPHASTSEAPLLSH